MDRTENGKDTKENGRQAANGADVPFCKCVCWCCLFSRIIE